MAASAPRDAGTPPGGARGGRRVMDPSHMTPEQLEQLKERMRARGLTEEEIEERLRRARERAGKGAE